MARAIVLKDGKVCDLLNETPAMLYFRTHNHGGKVLKVADLGRPEDGCTEFAEGQRDPLIGLMEAVARKDRRAFDELYRLTAPRLLGFAVKMLRRRDLAEEVLQESFLAIWQRAGAYDSEYGSPLGWLVTIVRHRAIDRLRSIGRARDVDLGREADIAETLADPTSKTEFGIVIEQAIKRCLQTIKARQRKLILLAFYYGFTHEELSKKTDAPLGTVKSELRRGLSGLRQCMES